MTNAGCITACTKTIAQSDAIIGHCEMETFLPEILSAIFTSKGDHHFCSTVPYKDAVLSLILFRGIIAQVDALQ